MKDKLTRLVSAVLAGGVLAEFSGDGVRVIILALFILMLVRWYLWWNPPDFSGRVIKPEVVLLVCSIITGFFYGMNAERVLEKPLVIKEIQLEGRLSNWILDGTRGQGVLLPDDDQKIKYGLGSKYTLLVYPDSQGNFKEEWKMVRSRDRIRVTGKLEQPMEPGSPGEFDPRIYNSVRGLSGKITTGKDAVLLEKGAPGLPSRIRDKVHTALSAYWPDEAGTLEGILFGDSGGIPEEKLEMYRASGVMHVFAASGANVFFIMILAWGVFFIFPAKFRILATLGVILLYAVLCQGNPPILRATILGAAVLVGKLGRGKISSLRWLVLAALGLFIINPLYLKDTSFQLSFAASWGMIVLSPRLGKLKGIRYLPNPLRLASTTTLGTQLSALPIMIDVFHRVSLVGFITNIFMLFLLGAVLQMGLIGCLLIWIPGVHLIFFQAAFWLLNAVHFGLQFAASFPWAWFWVLNPGVFFWIVWYGSLAVLLVGKEKIRFIVQVQFRKVNKLIQRYYPEPLQRMSDKSYRYYVSGLIIILLILWSPWKEEQKISITFMDVGQGDCILIQTPKEKLMVDTGPRTAGFDAGEKIVVPYLMDNRISSLDMLLITHEDGDHLGGAQYLLNNIPVEKVAVPEFGDSSDTAIWEDGIPAKILNDQGKLIRLGAGDCLRFASGLKIEVLAPVSYGKTVTESNSHSLVLMVEYLEQKVLLSGDMDKEEMQLIMNRGQEWDAVAVKLPHHGSKGSLDPDWFDKTSPQAVFISVGSNRFGHPSPEVLAYWRDRGVSVYRTDLQGTIRLVIEKKGLSVITGRT